MSKHRSPDEEERLVVCFVLRSRTPETGHKFIWLVALHTGKSNSIIFQGPLQCVFLWWEAEEQERAREREDGTEFLPFIRDPALQYSHYIPKCIALMCFGGDILESLEIA